MANPYLQPTQQQGGGARNFMRDLMTTLTPGHRTDRWATVQADRARDRGMAPDQIALRGKADEWEQADQKRKQGLADRDRKDSALTGSYVDYLKQQKAGGATKDGLLGFKSWQAMDQDARTGLLTGNSLNDPTSQMKNSAEYKRLRGLIAGAKDEEEKKRYQTELTDFGGTFRKGEIVDIAGVSYRRNAQTGAFEAIGGTDAQVREKMAQQKYDDHAQAKHGASAAEVDETFRKAMSDDVPDLRDQLFETEALAQAIRDGDYDQTGPIESIWGKFTNFETANLHAKSIMQTLRNLQITKLTPVSNYEIELVGNLFANIGNDPEANLGILEEAADFLRRKLGKYENQRQYWQKNGNSLRGYGMDEFGESLMTPKSAQKVDDDDSVVDDILGGNR